MEIDENSVSDPFIKKIDDSLCKKGFCLITLKKKNESSDNELMVDGKNFDFTGHNNILLSSDNIKEFLESSGKDKNRDYAVIDLSNSGNGREAEGNNISKDYIVYDTNECEVIEIERITDMIDAVFEQEDSLEDSGINLYFRGQKAHYDLLPSIFRNEDWVLHEAELNALIINDNPKEFLDCKSTFEKLVKLKHYNQPSRLLDITSNPLIALYFACECSENEKIPGIPVVITAYSDKSKEKQSVSSDTVTMLTGLANSSIPDDLIQKLRKKTYEENDLPFCMNKNKKYCWRKGYHNNINSERVVPKKNGESCFIWREKKQTKPENYNNKSMGEIIIGEIIHQCKKESGSELYWDDLCFNELNQCIVVNPPLNTDRIVRQNGCFIMCGLNPCAIFSPPESFYEFFKINDKKKNAEEKEAKNKKRRIYYVHPENIPNIQSQLKRIGITGYFVFPELGKDIEERKSKYEKF